MSKKFIILKFIFTMIVFVSGLIVAICKEPTVLSIVGWIDCVILCFSIFLNDLSMFRQQCTIEKLLNMKNNFDGVWESEFLIKNPRDKLIDKMIECNITPNQLADKIGVNEDFIDDLVAGEKEFSIDISEKLSEVFNTPKNYWSDLELKYNTQNSYKNKEGNEDD